MAALHISRAFLPALREGGADLFFFTCIAAYETCPGRAGYVALKTEWMRSNARVSCGDECCNETVIFQGIDIVLVVEQD